MIDIIVIRIHNINKYTKIYEEYYNPTKKSVTRAIVDLQTNELSSLTKAIFFRISSSIIIKL